MNTDQTSRVRESVATEYSKKVQQRSGFCAHTYESENAYDKDELAALPQDAVDNSFGCGNPLGFAAVGLGDTVVDLGSGAGMDVILAAQKVGATGKAIGVDMTGVMIQRARANIQQAGCAHIAEIREGLIESLPIESNSVDWVISNCVVSLSPEKDRVFSEVNRVLKPGGKMFITDLVAENIPYWIRALIAIHSPASAKAINEQQYITILQQSGLSNVEVKSRLVYDESVLKSLIRDELNKTGSLWSALLSFNKAQIFAHLVTPLLNPLSRMMSGKIASIKVYAEKSQ